MDIARLELEQIIIGTCLLEHGYERIAGVLTHKNFTASNSFDHQIIFKAIEAMYPARPIDLLTITHEINKPSYAAYLASCADKISSTAHLRYHAFMLLQTSMRDILIHTLNKAGSREFSITTKAAIQEIIDECLDSTNDILNIYEKAPLHLENIGADESLITELNNLKKGLEEKVLRIKRQAHIDCLIQNLERLAENGPNIRSQLCISQLTDIIKVIMINGRVKDDALIAIQSLREKLN